MASFQHVQYRPQGSSYGILAAILWALIIGLSALLAGFVAGLDTKIPAVLLIAVMAGVAILTMRANSVLWLLLIVTLVITGLVQYFGRINQIQWLPSLLAFGMFIRALLEGFGSRQTGAQMPKQGGMPAFMWWFIAFVFLALAANIGKFESALQFLAGIKNYLAIWGVLVLIVVAKLTPEQLERLWKGIIAIGLLQVPVIIFQHLFFASKRAATIAGYHRAAWDSVVGTFGGDPDGGGASGALALFLVVVLTLILALWKYGLVRHRTVIAGSLAVFVAIALGEVKVVLVILPLAVVMLFRGELLRRPLTLLGGLLLALAMVAITLAYQALYWDKSGGAKKGPMEHIERAIDWSFGVDSVDRVTGEMGRVATLALWVRDYRADAGERVLGHGFGSSRLSPVGAGRIAKRYYPYLVGSTAAAGMLWDIGVLGLLAFCAVLVSAAFTGIRLSRSTEIPAFHRAVLETAVVGIVLYFMAVFYSADHLYLPAMGFLLMLFLGQIAFWYRRVAVPRRDPPARTRPQTFPVAR